MIEAHWDGQGSFATHRDIAPDNYAEVRVMPRSLAILWRGAVAGVLSSA